MSLSPFFSFSRDCTFFVLEYELEGPFRKQPKPKHVCRHYRIENVGI
jgi:hypothetical protein